MIEQEDESMEVRNLNVYDERDRIRRLRKEIENPTTLLEKERKRLAEARYRATWKTYKTFKSSLKCKKLDWFLEMEQEDRETQYNKRDMNE
jgi:hypothetical protein